ncbi:DUF1963 domain-containing protein [Campylobacter showae]|uniref:DUF1963 domain-containing protein n=1 Tax=Campylobacter showae TaxID=204 RepID=UPI0028CFFA93|nr:DUF1963 domain-containing protein [Campylobacter showae]
MQNLRARYEKYCLGRIFEDIKNYTKNAVKISAKESADRQIPISASKFGGLLNMPRSEPWPANEQAGELLHFIAQINFSEVSEFEKIAADKNSIKFDLRLSSKWDRRRLPNLAKL